MTRLASFVAAALLLAGCAGSRFASAPEPMDVMSWNIRLDLASDGPNAWPFRKETVAARIAGQDLVGVQEALPSQLADLDVLLPGFARFGLGRDPGGTGEACAILYRKDRFDVLEQGTFWLSESPDVAGSRGWDAAYPRIATWGRLRDRASGDVFWHFNTHLDHVGLTARREGAELLLRKIREIAGTSPRVVVTGDFNAVPGSEPYVIMTGPLQDALEISREPHRGPDSTWNGFTKIEPGQRIDFIFVGSGFDVLEHAILVETTPAGRYTSDHFPVVATIVAGAD
ncbi:MAG: endonuclease/exonuclease/phosphatase family protein [Thermoanaerobaculia bacterium]